MEDNRVVKIFLDNEPRPFAEFSPPVKFTLDTTKIPDGDHSLKIVARSTSGKEGIKIVPFTVKNGPEISLVGLQDGEVISEEVPITVNAYGSERNDYFLIRGSETPKGIPAWVWALLVIFIAFGLFYITMYWKSDFYKSFF